MLIFILTHVSNTRGGFKGGGRSRRTPPPLNLPQTTCRNGACKVCGNVLTVGNYEQRVSLMPYSIEPPKPPPVAEFPSPPLQTPESRLHSRAWEPSGQGGRLHRRDPTMRLGGQLMYSAHPIFSDIRVHRRQRHRGHRDPDPPMFDLQGSINVLNPRPPAERWKVCSHPARHSRPTSISS